MPAVEKERSPRTSATKPKPRRRGRNTKTLQVAHRKPATT
jgi:hypothetical protein